MSWTSSQQGERGFHESSLRDKIWATKATSGRTENFGVGSPGRSRKSRQSELPAAVGTPDARDHTNSNENAREEERREGKSPEREKGNARRSSEEEPRRTEEDRPRGTATHAARAASSEACRQHGVGAHRARGAHHHRAGRRSTAARGGSGESRRGGGEEIWGRRRRGGGGRETNCGGRGEMTAVTGVNGGGVKPVKTGLPHAR